MSLISLGMSRPEWLKYIVSTVYHHKLDLKSPFDRNDLIYNENWGLLLQTFIWKRDAWEKEENFAGYGIGSLQMQNKGTLSVLQASVSSDKLCFDIVNDILSLIRKENIDQLSEDLTTYFKYTPGSKILKERLIELVNLAVPERKRGLFGLFVWIIDNAILQDNKDIAEKANVFSVAYQLIRIIEELGADNYKNISTVQRLLCSEKAPDMEAGLKNIEIAALIHDLLRTEKTSSIPVSFALYDLVKQKSPTARIDDMDGILRESYRRLPSDDQIQKYIDRLYGQVKSLLSHHVRPSSLMSYYDYSTKLNPAKAKRIAVLWEYSIIVGELEEIMRIFVSDRYQNPPYEFKFEQKYNELLRESEHNWNDVIGKFEGLAVNVLNNPTYFNSFQSEGEEYLLDIPNWFKIVFSESSKNFSLKSKFESLLVAASQVGESISFHSGKVRVLKSPSPTHPLIARDSFYQWLRTFEGIWE